MAFSYAWPLVIAKSQSKSQVALPGETLESPRHGPGCYPGCYSGCYGAASFQEGFQEIEAQKFSFSVLS
jgi:hypothetical protein